MRSKIRLKISTGRVSIRAAILSAAVPLGIFIIIWTWMMVAVDLDRFLALFITSLVLYIWMLIGFLDLPRRPFGAAGFLFA